MAGKFIHYCIHVLDRDASIEFYREALGLEVVRVMEAEDKTWSNTYMATKAGEFEIELTWNKGRVEPYENGGKDLHIAFEVEDYEESLRHHEQMGCVEKVNDVMGIYFINDPDGIRIEIVPEKFDY